MICESFWGQFSKSLLPPCRLLALLARGGRLLALHTALLAARPEAQAARQDEDAALAEQAPLTLGAHPTLAARTHAVAISCTGK